MVNYGLTPEQIEKLEEESDGRCALCGEPHERLVIDHSHRTGKVRGLLGADCNAHLGVIEKRGQAWLIAALDYLDRTEGPMLS
jgi:Recombination endonuclease VII